PVRHLDLDRLAEPLGAVHEHELAGGFQRAHHALARLDRGARVAGGRQLPALHDVLRVGERRPPLAMDRVDRAAGVVEVEVREDDARDGLPRDAVAGEVLEQRLDAAPARPGPEPRVEEEHVRGRPHEEGADGDEEGALRERRALLVGDEHLVEADGEAALGEGVDREVAVLQGPPQSSPAFSEASTMSMTRRWRTTSPRPRATSAMPSMPSGMSRAWTSPLCAVLGRSVCVMSPVTMARLPAPRRVRNIFIWLAVAFCASSRMTNAEFIVRPRMYASGTISTVFCSRKARSFSRGIMSS